MDAQLHAIILDLINTDDREAAHASCARLLRAWPRINWPEINEAICVLVLSKLNAPEEGHEGGAELVTAARLCELVERVSTAFPEPEGESLEVEEEEEDDDDDDDDELELSFIDDSPLRKLKKARRQQ
jgi:hypothetical protein